MSHQGDLEKIFKRAEELGFRVEKRKEYYLVFPPDGSSNPCRAPGTGHTRGHGLENFKACLRKNGYKE